MNIIICFMIILFVGFCFGFFFGTLFESFSTKFWREEYVYYFDKYIKILEKE